mgnify:FL=1
MENYKNYLWLKKKYADEGLSLREIAEICSVSNHLIAEWVRKFGIKIKKTEPLDKEWLIQKYVIEKIGMYDIAKLLNQSYNKVRYWMDKYGIERRNKSEVKFLVNDGKQYSEMALKRKSNKEAFLIKRCLKCNIIYDYYNEGDKHQMAGKCIK